MAVYFFDARRGRASALAGPYAENRRPGVLPDALSLQSRYLCVDRIGFPALELDLVRLTLRKRVLRKWAEQTIIRP